MSVSGMDLSKVPAAAPPLGTTSNLVDPYDRGSLYITVAVVFLSITTIFVLIRLWLRLITQKAPWWDDLACVLALFVAPRKTYLSHHRFWILADSRDAEVCRHGIGVHIWDLSAARVLKTRKELTAMAALTEAAVGLPKLTLLLLYYRLFARHFMTKVGIIGGIAVIVPAYTILLFLFIFLDQPSQLLLNKTVGVFNVLSDFYVLVLPLPVVSTLNVSKKKKAALIGLFSTGLFACVMSLIGAVYRFRFSSVRSDPTWDLLDVILVNTIECCVGIMCSCLPLFPALSKKDAILGQSADWFKVTLHSLRNRLLSSRSQTWSEPGDETLYSGRFYWATYRRGQASSVTVHGKPHVPSDSSVELAPVPRIPDEFAKHGIGNDSRVVVEDVFQGDGRPPMGVEVRKDYYIQREGSTK